jgi:hypothetical protein
MAAHAVITLRASDLGAEQLSGIVADFLAIEEARILRRLLVTRFGILALGVAVLGFGFHWLPPFASWFTLALFLTPPSWAWIVELRRDWRLARRLEDMPGAATHELSRPMYEKS